MFQIQTIDEDLVEIVEGVEGVDEILPGLQSVKVVPIDADGEPLETLGPPVLALNHSDSSASALAVEEGEAPDGPGEFTMDLTAADRYDFVVGETYDVVGADGREPFTLVGTVRFGEENALAGAVLMTFTLEELQIESYYPLDDATEAACRHLAG